MWAGLDKRCWGAGVEGEASCAGDYLPRQCAAAASVHAPTNHQAPHPPGTHVCDRQEAAVTHDQDALPGVSCRQALQWGVGRMRTEPRSDGCGPST